MAVVAVVFPKDPIETMARRDFGSEDPLLGNQLGPSTPAQPERALLAAVLEGAIDDLRLAGRSSRQRFGAEALAWIESDASGPFSFVMICTTFELDPGTVRRRVLATYRDATLPRFPHRTVTSRQRLTHHVGQPGHVGPRRSSRLGSAP